MKGVKLHLLKPRVNFALFAFHRQWLNSALCRESARGLAPLIVSWCLRLVPVFCTGLGFARKDSADPDFCTAF